MLWSAHRRPAGERKALARKEKTGTALDRESWPLVRRLLADHVRVHAGRIGLALVFMTAVAGTTAALAWLIQPILDGAGEARGLMAGAAPAASGSGAATEAGAADLGAAIREANFASLHFYAGIILVMFVAKGLATYGQAVLMNHVGQRILADMQIRLYRHLIRADLAFFHNTATGTLISRFNNDIQLMRNTVTTVLTNIGRDVLTLIGLVGVMFWQDWMLASVTFVLGPLAIIPVVRLGRRMRKVSTSTQQELGRFTTLLEETFRGARHVKAYGMETYESARAETLVNRIFSLILRATRIRSMSAPIMESLGGVAIVAVILYGGYQVIGGARTEGAFFSFVVALLLAYDPAKKLANLNASLQEGLAAARRIFDTLDTEPLVVDRPGATALEVGKGRIAFEDVHFTYEGGEAAALGGITLEVPAGRTVALVGPSGAGKTTILNLIPRFHDVDSGRVTIDDTDLREVTLASLRASIGLVSQEITLFDDTVRANIAYGRPDATEAEIAAAARAAAADDFIEALPAGYDTRVGGEGVRLSGGQRQRIAIARAMLRNAPILLLDEATSSLDPESEARVRDALARLMAGRTTLVIAHRLSTVIGADLIHVIEDGRVRESGTHESLLAAGGAYARLYARQLAAQADGDGAGARTDGDQGPAGVDAAPDGRPLKRARV